MVTFSLYDIYAAPLFEFRFVQNEIHSIVYAHIYGKTCSSHYACAHFISVISIVISS